MHLTMMHMGIIIATLVCVIGIGIYSSRSVRSAAGYSVGGRSAGAPLVAGSIAGTVVGGGATVGTAQLAYHFGLSAWWFTLGSGIAFIVMGLFYAKKMRGTGLETIPQFLAMHYGKKAEELSSVISSIGILFSAVASCLPGIEIVAEVFHVDAYTASDPFGRCLYLLWRDEISGDRRYAENGDHLGGSLHRRMGSLSGGP